MGCSEDEFNLQCECLLNIVVFFQGVFNISLSGTDLGKTQFVMNEQLVLTQVLKDLVYHLKPSARFPKYNEKVSKFVFL